MSNSQLESWDQENCLKSKLKQIMKANSKINSMLKNEVEKNKLKMNTKNNPSQPRLTR
jgi:hypothetical protein